MLMPHTHHAVAHHAEAHHAEAHHAEAHHAEYPAFSVGENLSPDTAGHMAHILMRTTASPGGSLSEPLFTERFK
jgi:hypothetical protein